MANVLPPQAYTREMLSQAFNWLQTQPDSVKSQATNPENLIAIFIKAQRMRGTSQPAAAQPIESVEAPVSSQNFLHDLRSLAEGLKQFDTSEAPRPAAEPVAHRPPPPHVPHVQQQPQPHAAPHTHSVPHQPALAMSARSLLLIREVKEKLGLSSEGEVLNMMLTIAYKNLKNLIGD